MEQGFITILKQLIDERGKEALLNTSKCKAFLTDYTKNEYKKESRLLLNALEAGTQKAINASTELPLCKKQQIRLLCEDYSLAENMATDVVDTLAFVLRGDVSPASNQSGGIQITPTIGSTIPFGGYDWRVLDVKNNKALLLSEKVLEEQVYHSSRSDTTWETCTLRSYLNGTFYNTFSENDKARIPETRVTTNNNPWYGTKGGADTNDRIFLLSIEEAVKYFGDSSQLQNRPKDALYINDQYNKERIAKDAAGAVSWWWLRSPASRANTATYVDSDGKHSVFGRDVDYDSIGIRPA